MQKALIFNDIAIFSVKGIDYRIHFWYMSKDEGITILRNADLNEKNPEICKIKFFFHVFERLVKKYHVW